VKLSLSLVIAFSSARNRIIGRRVKTRTPTAFRRSGFINSGNVLLSRNLEMHYHRGCSVSLPCSEWGRVVPLRYYHQKAGEAEVSPRREVWGRSHLNFTRKSGAFESVICGCCLAAAIDQPPACNHRAFFLQRTGVFPEICIWEEIFLSSICKKRLC
jgi:hypothetical protein